MQADGYNSMERKMHQERQCIRGSNNTFCFDGKGINKYLIYGILTITTSVIFLFPNLGTARVACVISQLQGEISVVRIKTGDHKATNFEKILAGDHIKLYQGAKARLCFLTNDRIEEWSGPVDLIVQAQETQDVLNTKKPVVSCTGEETTYLNESKLLTDQKDLISGEIHLRGVLMNVTLNENQQQELRVIEEKLGDLSARPPGGDYTADLYYLACLEHLGQKASMYQYIKKLLERESGNENLLKMLQKIYD
jgi:hypothetical protein